MRIKGNWAAGIVILYGGFAVFIVGFLVFASFQKVELVAPDYYEQEIRYEEQLERIRRTKGLPDGLTWSLAARELTVQFPETLRGKTVSGTIVLYRASDASADRRIPVAIDANLRQIVPLHNLRTGHWRVKLEWKVDSQSYYDEENFTL